MSRPTMFIPANFTIKDATSFRLVDCKVFENQKCNERSYNKYKHTISGAEIIEDWDIYLETTKAEFFDKLEAVIMKEEVLV